VEEHTTIAVDLSKNVLEVAVSRAAVQLIHSNFLSSSTVNPASRMIPPIVNAFTEVVPMNREEPNAIGYDRALGTLTCDPKTSLLERPDGFPVIYTGQPRHLPGSGLRLPVPLHSSTSPRPPPGIRGWRPGYSPALPSPSFPATSSPAAPGTSDISRSSLRLTCLASTPLLLRRNRTIRPLL